MEMLLQLYHAPDIKKGFGTATIGSKTKWKNKRKKENKVFSKPNLVVGAGVHTCWDTE